MATALLQAPGLNSFQHLKLSSSPMCRKPALLSGATGRQRLLISRRFHLPKLKLSERRDCHTGGVNASFSSAEDIKSRADEAAGGEKASKVENVVIVGGGIAGMATALAFHRMGVKSIVLEQSPTLRVAGTSLAIWTNGWRALEALGVEEQLKERTLALTGIEIITSEGKFLTSLRLADKDSNLRFQAVERKILLEILLEPLPVGTVQFDSRVVKVSKINGEYSQVELHNGSTIQTKVLIGCDGIGSVVARYLGLEHSNYAGYVGIRGMGVYSEEHGLKRVLMQIVGKGVRTGCLPLDSKRVYWFVVFNRPIGSKITDLKAVKEEALSSVQGWPQVIVDVINHTPLESLNRAAISDRWMLPFTSSRFFRGGVTVAGDAMHPVTPNLGQGGCCALEDAVILGRLLSKVIRGKEGSTNGRLKGGDSISEMKRIEDAFKSYTSGRQERMFPLAVTAYGIGALLQVEPDLLCQARNFVVSNMMNSEIMASSTRFDCGTLV